MAERSDRRRDKAVNDRAPSRPLQRLAPGARIPCWPGAERLHTRGRIYDCSPSPAGASAPRYANSDYVPLDRREESIYDRKARADLAGTSSPPLALRRVRETRLALVCELYDDLLPCLWRRAVSRTRIELRP
jgi:hypothetical protein